MWDRPEPGAPGTRVPVAVLAVLGQGAVTHLGEATLLQLFLQLLNLLVVTQLRPGPREGLEVQAGQQQGRKAERWEARFPTDPLTGSSHGLWPPTPAITSEGLE